MMHICNTYVCNSCTIYRNVPSRPVSEVLSSQVTKETGTSPDTAVQLTFKYSVNVSILCMQLNLIVK